MDGGSTNLTRRIAPRLRPPAPQTHKLRVSSVHLYHICFPCFLGLFLQFIAFDLSGASRSADSANQAPSGHVRYMIMRRFAFSQHLSTFYYHVTRWPHTFSPFVATNTTFYFAYNGELVRPPSLTWLISMAHQFVIRRQKLMKDKELYPNAVVRVLSLLYGRELISLLR